jgi:hypothetical protein
MAGTQQRDAVISRLSSHEARVLSTFNATLPAPHPPAPPTTTTTTSHALAQKDLEMIELRSAHLRYVADSEEARSALEDRVAELTEQLATGGAWSRAAREEVAARDRQLGLARRELEEAVALLQLAEAEAVRHEAEAVALRRRLAEEQGNSQQLVRALGEHRAVAERGRVRALEERVAQLEAEAEVLHASAEQAQAQVAALSQQAALQEAEETTRALSEYVKELETFQGKALTELHERDTREEMMKSALRRAEADRAELTALRAHALTARRHQARLAAIAQCVVREGRAPALDLFLAGDHRGGAVEPPLEAAELTSRGLEDLLTLLADHYADKIGEETAAGCVVS